MVRRHRSPRTPAGCPALSPLATRLLLLLLVTGGLLLIAPGAVPPVRAQCAPPMVTVTASPRVTLVGQPVSFRFSAVAGAGCVNPPLPGMLINFGDGTAPLPLDGPWGRIQHTYAAPGTYSVLVTATSADQTGQATTTVTVTPLVPQSVLTLSAAPSSVSAGQAVDFTGQVVSAPPGAITTDATIDFGDGQSAIPQVTGAGFIAQHTYASPGAYTATLTVHDTTGRSSQAMAEVVVTSPVQPFSVTLTTAPASGLVGQRIDFTGQVVTDTPGAITTSVTLDFGDGQTTTPLTTGAGFIAQHSYASPGLYTATLSVTDSAGRTSQAMTTVLVYSGAASWP